MRYKGEDERKKKKQSELENTIFQLIEKSLKAAVDQALEDIFKEWNF